MSEILPEPLPPSATWGHVVGRVVEWVADTGSDTDDDPEAYPVEGKVTFRPRAPMRSIDDPAPFGSWVVQTTESFQLVDGWVVDREGRPQLALVAGIYDVSFDLVSGTIAPFSIEVTAAHTVENPLNLRTAAPWTPPEGVVLETVQVPIGGLPGQVLARTAEGVLRWEDPPRGDQGPPGASMMTGAGQPNGAVTAPVGTLFFDTARTAGASVWVKTAGAGNTGWEVTKANTGVVKVVEWDSAGTVTKGSLPANLTPRSGGGFIAFAREGDTASLIIRGADITGSVSILCPAWARPVTNARTILAHNDGTAMVSVGTNVLVIPSGTTRAMNPFSAVATWPLFGTPWPETL